MHSSKRYPLIGIPGNHEQEKVTKLIVYPVQIRELVPLVT